MLDHREFAVLTANARVPKLTVSEKDREEVRDWVLQMSLEKNLKADYEFRLDRGKLLMLLDREDKMCHITGLSISGETVKCSGCSKNMNRDDWNDYVMIFKVFIFFIKTTYPCSNAVGARQVKEITLNNYLVM